MFSKFVTATYQRV